MEYLHWKEIIEENLNSEKIIELYDKGFVFTRIDKGVLHQTRSVRIDLNKFELNSENRRILRKGENIILKENPIPFSNYSWEIGKMAKDFYDKKANGAFSANKIKELIITSHNFNNLLSFNNLITNSIQGYAICYKNKEIIHYCYPFYDIQDSIKDMGLIMIIKTILMAKDVGLKYMYLGSLQRVNDSYKLQFDGIEWFDGNIWKSDLKEIKDILKG